MYDYQKEKSSIFTEDGQVKFLEIRDKANRLIEQAGAVSMAKLFVTGDTWESMACVDRMVELGELKEVTCPNSCWAQHRVFIKLIK